MQILMRFARPLACPVLRFIAAGLLLTPFAFAAPDSTGSEGGSAVLFSQKVHPLLEAKCFGCHGEEKDREADLDMRSREGLLKGGESGAPALVPGKPDDSPLFRAVLRTDKLKMPPKERNRLSDEEIETLRQWILAGAPWTEPASRAVAKWDYKEEDLWAFRPVKSVAIPETPDANQRTQNPIDAFIREKLNGKGLKPAPRADKLALLRRVTFDLTGLPPTLEEIKAFQNDTSPEAFDKVVERLLASPRYGERWGRHWLDVVRYADSDGFSNDYERPNAWRYRDYVIRSFNADKPYDQFVMEQIAGDEMDSGDPEKLIAVGMLRMGPWEHTGMSVEAVTRQLFLDDVAHSVATTFNALTLACAKCHDHKFDPIPAKDYYRFQSIFAPAQFELRDVPFLPGENTRGFSEKTERVSRFIELNREKLAAIRAKRDAAVKAYVKERGVKNLRDLPLKERPKREYGLTHEDLGLEKVLRKRIEFYERELQRYAPKAYSVSSGGLAKKVETPALHVLLGGALESPGEAVLPGVLSAVHNSDDSKLATDWNTIPQSTEGRRLKLAQWIASPEHPLTARVMVNRIWQHHFGKGLVKSSNNFGKMGNKPTHPELLDWLAGYFVERGWSVKEMHRLIVRSHSYQQSTQHPDMEAIRSADPEEPLWARFLPRRLTAEELRDSVLFVSGQLNLEMGGPGVFPEINLEAALQPRHVMGSTAPPFVPSPTRAERNRRTVYTIQIRSLINPLLEVFNSAPTENACERRDETTVTPQVFALFNSQFAHDFALAMADRVARSAKGSSGQIKLAFELAYGRSPTAKEMKACQAHLKTTFEHHRKTAPADFQYPVKVTRAMVEELTGEMFEFEEDWDMAGYQYNLRPSEVTPQTRALAELCLVLLNSNEFVYVY